MFNKIKEELKKANLKSASVNMFVYPDDTYVIVPLGRSPEKKWFGAKNLNYKITGSISEDENNKFTEKLYEGFSVSYDYVNKGVEPLDKDVEPRFITEGSKNDFKNYYYFSIILFATTDLIRIDSLKPVDKKGRDWIAKSDTSTELSISDTNNIYESLKKYLTTQSR